jgi:hypothetical protein
MNVQTESPRQKIISSSNRKKDIGKFFSGFAANQVLVHGTLGLYGITFSLFGIQYTQTLNFSAAAIWAVITILLMSYAWKRN